MGWDGEEWLPKPLDTIPFSNRDICKMSKIYNPSVKFTLYGMVKSKKEDGASYMNLQSRENSKKYFVSPI